MFNLQIPYSTVYVLLGLEIIFLKIRGFVKMDCALDCFFMYSCKFF